MTGSGPLRMQDTVLLDDLRCDGGAHEGCQAGCRIYWKEAWLRPVKTGEAHVSSRPMIRSSGCEAWPQEARGRRRGPTRRQTSTDARRRSYSATTPLGWWNARSFSREVSCGNVSPWTFVRVSVRLVLEEIVWRLGLRKPIPFQRTGESQVETPLWGVHPGQTVRVRSAGDIRRTLDASGKLRGLWFDREMLPYCGTEATVKTKVGRFVDEKSGAMVNLESDCVILDGVVCKGHRSRGRWFCPRAMYPWWREAWLEPGSEA